MLTQKKLKKYLHYSRLTGFFTWIKKPCSKVRVGDRAGTINGAGYVQITLKGKIHLAHRLSFLYCKGYLPEAQVDHKDRIRHNNRWRNLREASPQCQSRNAKVHRTNTSGVQGVYFSDRDQKWYTVMKVDNKNNFLGTFTDFDEAVYHRFAAEQCVHWATCSLPTSAEKHLRKVRY